MSDYPSKRCNCQSKSISYKEIKLWATAYLRLKDKPTNHKGPDVFKEDIKIYKDFVREYFDDFNKNVNTTLRVAFLTHELDFPGDPYVKLSIYLEYTDPVRYFETRKGQGAPEGPGGPSGEGSGGGESVNPETNGGKEISMDGTMSGPGTVTPPRCPPDAPTLRVSRVTYTDCGY